MSGENNIGAGFFPLQRQQNLLQEASSENLGVPAHVINQTTNSRIRQLKPNTLEKVKTELNKITNQSKKNTVISKIKTESNKITGELDDAQKTEIEKGIL